MRVTRRQHYHIIGERLLSDPNHAVVTGGMANKLSVGSKLTMLFTDGN